MIGIPLGMLYANAGEWVIHKYILHGLGRRKSSFWSFHWHEHHRAARKHQMVDDAYRQPLRGWNAQTKEALALGVGALCHLPLLPVAPFFVGTVWFSMAHYFHVHRKAHLDPEWAEAHLPWHVDHHLGKNADANWCVTRPWFDQLMGTRVTDRSSFGARPSGARGSSPTAPPPA